MKTLVLFALIAVALAEEFYTTGDDHLDVGALLADRPRLNLFLDCYLDKGPCTKLAASYKKVIPEAVEQACKKCNKDQKHIFWEFLKGLKVISPEDYQKFRKRFDPENKYFEALEKEISQY